MGVWVGGRLVRVLGTRIGDENGFGVGNGVGNGTGIGTGIGNGGGNGVGTRNGVDVVPYEKLSRISVCSSEGTTSPLRV